MAKSTKPATKNEPIKESEYSGEPIIEAEGKVLPAKPVREPNKVTNKWARAMSVQEAESIVEKYKNHKKEAPPELIQAKEVLSNLK